MFNEQLAVTAIRMLGVEAITKAKSGHPGIVLGAAPILHTLITRHLRVNPRDTKWFDRDRFILSAGHGSALLYSAYHMMGFEISMEDIKNLRQAGSKTPGHPEVNQAEGVDATTGPLGQGIGMSVGMAIAEEFLSKKFNTPDMTVIDHYTYVICGDGDLQEGICQEAMSMAGHLGLGKLIILYDSNDIQLDGEVSMAYSDNTKMKYEALNWQYLKVEDGTDIEAIDKAIIEAKKETKKPTIIEVKTTIGYNAPGAGTSSCHGKPYSVDDLAVIKKNYNWNYPDFEIPQEVYDFYQGCAKELGIKKHMEWNTLLSEYQKKYPDLYTKLSIAAGNNFEIPDLTTYKLGESLSTRVAGGKALAELSKYIECMIGGSADLSCSCMVKGADGDFTKDNRLGRNINFGVREHAMGAIANGMVLHDGIKSFVGGFFVFSDYMKPAMRMASIMSIGTVFAFSHDTIAVGEDGPTHQPIEQAFAIRTIPNMILFRPADPNETVYAFELAFKFKKIPSTILMTRQNINVLEGTSYDGVSKGGYVISEAKGEMDGILLATGSEVSLALEAQKELEKQGKFVRVVSMPSTNLFDMQSATYREEVLPKGVKTLAIEMGTSLGWYKYADDVLGIDKFGISAPLKVIVPMYGFTVENVVKKYLEIKK